MGRCSFWLLILFEQKWLPVLREPIPFSYLSALSQECLTVKPDSRTKRAIMVEYAAD